MTNNLSDMNKKGLISLVKELQSENENLIGWKNGINPKPLKVFVRVGEAIDQVKKLATVDLQALDVLALHSAAKSLQWVLDCRKLDLSYNEVDIIAEEQDKLLAIADRLERGE